MSYEDDLDRLLNRVTRFAKTIKSVKEYDENLQAVHRDIDDHYIERVFKLHRESEYIASDFRSFARSLPLETKELAEKNLKAAANDMGYDAERTKEGWLRVTLPPLIHRKKAYAISKEIYFGLAYAVMKDLYTEELVKNQKAPAHTDCFVILKHVLSPSDKVKDYDNLERKVAIDAVGLFFLQSDSMNHIDLLECSGKGDKSFLVVYIVPRKEITDWLNTYKNAPEMLKK